MAHLSGKNAKKKIVSRLAKMRRSKNEHGEKTECSDSVCSSAAQRKVAQPPTASNPGRKREQHPRDDIPAEIRMPHVTVGSTEKTRTEEKLRAISNLVLLC
mmetsp:Transcript_28942/g.59236  ORF Transcript_28942/g.59236 Transcript_28942/m.59236 type:complete len:101 (-) Transcript_28942:19-321(-)